MDQLDRSSHQVNAALFVDFDNVYLNLQNHDPDVARHFASNPDRWLVWLEQQLPSLQLSLEPVRRRILMRRCYLNPQAFSAFRPFFTTSAFEVIDCPPLTRQGKTSTDIHLVMDVLDTLSHPAHVSEFIILSGDADFTPLLLRLRKHNRWSAALATGYVSPAYKAACDYVISRDIFIKEALGFADQDVEVVESPPKEIAPPTKALLKKMAQRLHEGAADPAGIAASDLRAIYREFDEVRQSSTWLGFHSLRALTEALVKRRPDLVILEEDLWRVARGEIDKEQRDAASLNVKDGQPGAVLDDKVRAALAELITKAVRSSDRALPLAVVAQMVQQHLGKDVLDSAWLGAGTFKKLLTQLDLDGLHLSNRTPGYIYDPRRHELPADVPTDGGGVASQAPADPFLLHHPDLAPLARTISRLTDMPYLMPEHYALLFQELAQEINTHGYERSRTSRTVRDRCVEKGAPVARSHVNFVLTGITHVGHSFGQDGPEDIGGLREAVIANTLNLCASAELELSDAERLQIRQWIAGESVSSTGDEHLAEPQRCEFIE